MPVPTFTVPSQLERARIIENVMEFVQKQPSRRQFPFVLRHRKVRRTIEYSLKLSELPSVSSELVSGTKSRRWE